MNVNRANDSFDQQKMIVSMARSEEDVSPSLHHLGSMQMSMSEKDDIKLNFTLRQSDRISENSKENEIRASLSDCHDNM